MLKVNGDWLLKSQCSARSKSFGSFDSFPKNKWTTLLGNIDIFTYSEDILMDIDEGIASIHTNVIS